jgi:hypothetical protein
MLSPDIKTADQSHLSFCFESRPDNRVSWNWSRILLGKWPLTQLLKNFQTFHGTQKFVIVFKKCILLCNTIQINRQLESVKHNTGRSIYYIININIIFVYIISRCEIKQLRLHIDGDSKHFHQSTTIYEYLNTNFMSDKVNTAHCNKQFMYQLYKYSILILIVIQL